MTVGQEGRCQLTGDNVCAAESVRISSVTWQAGTLGAMGPSAALSSGSTRIGQITGVLTIPVITNLVIWAHTVGGAARQRGCGYVRKGTGIVRQR